MANNIIEKRHRVRARGGPSSRPSKQPSVEKGSSYNKKGELEILVESVSPPPQYPVVGEDSMEIDLGEPIEASHKAERDQKVAVDLLEPTEATPKVESEQKVAELEAKVEQLQEALKTANSVSAFYKKQYIYKALETADLRILLDRQINYTYDLCCLDQ